MPVSTLLSISTIKYPTSDQSIICISLSEELQVRLSAASQASHRPQVRSEIEPRTDIQAARAAEDIAKSNARKWEARATDAELRARATELELGSAKKLVMEGLHVAGRLQAEVTALKAQLAASQGLVKQLQGAAKAKAAEEEKVKASAAQQTQQLQAPPPQAPGLSSMVEMIKKEIEEDLRKNLLQQVMAQVRTEMRPGSSTAAVHPPPPGIKPPPPQGNPPSSVPSKPPPPPPPGAGPQLETRAQPSATEKNININISTDASTPPWLHPHAGDTERPSSAEPHPSDAGRNQNTGHENKQNDARNNTSRPPPPPREAPICYDSEIEEEQDQEEDSEGQEMEAYRSNGPYDHPMPPNYPPVYYPSYRDQPPFYDHHNHNHPSYPQGTFHPGVGHVPWMPTMMYDPNNPGYMPSMPSKRSRR